MKPYEKYKDSGVDGGDHRWIGEIPEHWSKLKIGRTFRKIGSGTTPNTNTEKYYEDGNINWLNTGDLNDSYITSTKKKITQIAIDEISTLKLSSIDSIVIALYGATIGKLGHLKIETTTNQACCVLSESEEIENRYLFYFLMAAKNFIISKAYGGGQPNISQDLIKQLYITAPSQQEQTAIAKYLDHQTAIIDELIEKKTKQIALLKEKRQAIINETVTKGLDPTVKMKDSGVDSFGQIPENWTLTKLKFLSKIKGRIGFRGYTTNDLVEEGEGALTLGATHITWEGDIDLSNPVFISWDKYEESPEIKLNKEDIIIVQRGSTCGKVAIISEEIGYATINPSLVILKEVNANPFYVFLSIKAALEALVNLTRSAAIPMLSQEQIGNLQIALPPLEEQDRIAEYLNKVKIKFEYAIKQCSDSIEKLKEYRQSLISEAVTGKIDVREWQKN